MAILRLGSRSIEMAPFWRYSGSMPSIQIKNVPEEVHRALQRKAKASGQSLQEFLQAELRHISELDLMSDVLERARGRKTDVTLEQIVQMIRQDRESH
ncbi:MAG: hypothetical protein KDB52_11345 [Solirubrobacterales bacterium]|nr:hypothetical protein [Solirubrobacterales bacterium]